MANKWNYKNGAALPTLYGAPSVVIAPDDDVVGNVRYVDMYHPNASNSASNRGCANVPYLSLQQFITDAGVGTVAIIAPGTYVISTNTVGENFVADIPLTVKISGSGSQIISLRGYNGIIFLNSVLMTGFGGTIEITQSIISSEINSSSTNVIRSLILKNIISCLGISYSVIIRANVSGSHYYCLLYDCSVNATSLSDLRNNIFWLGTLNYNTYTSDITTICNNIETGYITESQGIAQVESDLNLSVGDLANNGFRLLNPHFIDISKGNFNIDFENYDCSSILTLRDSYNWIINRGVRCNFPDDFVGGAGFGYSANSLDGFGGSLYSRNINNVGVITNSAYDTVLVTKKYSLSSLISLAKINYFDKILGSVFSLNANAPDGSDTPSLYTCYVCAVASGNLEDYINSDNFTFSYSAGGILTCNLPEFLFNNQLRHNRIGDVLLGEIDNGSFNIDELRNIYENIAALEFRLIFVKRGI